MSGHKHLEIHVKRCLISCIIHDYLPSYSQHNMDRRVKSWIWDMMHLLNYLLKIFLNLYFEDYLSSNLDYDFSILNLLYYFSI